MRRLANAVPLVRIDHEAGRYVHGLQRMPIFDRLRRRHLDVALPGVNEGGSPRVLDRADRRNGPVRVRVLVHRFAEVRDHPLVDAVDSVIADPVGQAATRDDRLETVGLGVGPHRHEAAVAVAHEAEAIVVYWDSALGCVHAG